MPLLLPQSAGRAGAEPQLIKLPTLRDEAEFIVRRLKEAHRAGMPWCDMAVIYREYQRDASLIRRLLPAMAFRWCISRMRRTARAKTR